MRIKPIGRSDAKDGKIDGIVTNWGNPLQGFNDFMKFHIERQFYTSSFFIVMSKAKFDGLPAEIRAAIDSISGDVWVAKFDPYWDKWDRPVREGRAMRLWCRMRGESAAGARRSSR